MISNNEFDDWGQAASTAHQDQESAPGVDLMQVAMRRKGLIALGVFMGLCLGLLYFARATEKFESSARMLIREQSSLWQTRDNENAMSLGAGFSKADDHAIGIASPRIISDALEQNDDLKELPSLSSAEDKVRVVLRGLEVSPLQEGSDVLQLVYRGTNAEDCGQILDAVMQTYTDFLNKKREDLGKVAVDQLTDARDDLQVKRDKLNQEYEDWKKQESRLFQQNDQGIILEQVHLAKIEDEIFATQQKIGKLASEIGMLEDSLQQPNADPEALMMTIQASRETRGLLQADDFENQLSRAEEQFRVQQQAVLLENERLAMKYGPDHPRRRGLQRELALRKKLFEDQWEAISNLEKEKGEEEGAGGNDTIDTLQSYTTALHLEASTEEKELQRLLNLRKDVSEAAKALLEDAARDAWFKKEIAAHDTLFQQAVEKLTQIDLSEQYGSDERYRIERFSDPGVGVQTDPSLSKSLAGGTMLGFLAGFGLGYLVELFDKTFRSPQEVSDTLQLPMIGHIPEIIPEPVEGTALSDTLIAAHKPKSPLAENFRAIRTALYFSTAGQQNRVIQTTSPVPGDGKSTLTANLAITIAQSNKSVLVVDADFRRPTQHKLLGLRNETGLSSVVVGAEDPLQAVQQTEIPNLHLMSCGPRPHNPSELLTSPQFADLLEVLREQYDFLLIDTPPVLAVTDPGIVSARVDGVIMALRIRKNGRPGAVRARKILRDLDANMLGIVVNGIDHRSGAYGYYSNYRRGYGYGNYGGYGKSQEAAEKMITKYYEEPPTEENIEARQQPS